jgi:phage gp36-like protein
VSYATRTDLERRYGVAQLLQIADRDDDQVIDAPVVAQALAEAMVNAYLAPRYDLPLATVPPLLLGLCCDSAFYKLHPAAQPEDVRQRYLDALKTLEHLGSGKAALDLPAGGMAAPADSGASIAGPGRIFSRDSLQGL